MFKIDEFTIREMELIEKLVDEEIESLYGRKERYKNLDSLTRITNEKIEALTLLKTKIIEYNKTKNYIKERFDKRNK